MTGRASYLLPGLLLAAALILASCGAGGGAQGGSRGGSGDSGGMRSMDNGDSGGETTGGRGGLGDEANVDHSSYPVSEDMADMSRKMVMPNGKYSDKAFIDAMVPHHKGAVEMAQVALENGQRPEIKQLAEDIVAAQEAEIQTLGGIRERKFGSAESTAGMGGMNMRTMGMTDPRKLAKKHPFDRAFIDAMTPHHESAIAMAQVALDESGDPEIRSLAEDIVSAQEREISRMKQWRERWYPEG